MLLLLLQCDARHHGASLSENELTSHTGRNACVDRCAHRHLVLLSCEAYSLYIGIFCGSLPILDTGAMGRQTEISAIVHVHSWPQLGLLE